MSKASIHRRSFLSRSVGAGAGLALTGFPGLISAPRHQRSNQCRDRGSGRPRDRSAEAIL